MSRLSLVAMSQRLLSVLMRRLPTAVGSLILGAQALRCAAPEVTKHISPVAL